MPDLQSSHNASTFAGVNVSTDVGNGAAFPHRIAPPPPRNTPSAYRGQFAYNLLRQNSPGIFLLPCQWQRLGRNDQLVQLDPQLRLHRAQSLRRHPVLPS